MHFAARLLPYPLESLSAPQASSRSKGGKTGKGLEGENGEGHERGRKKERGNIQGDRRPYNWVHKSSEAYKLGGINSPNDLSPLELEKLDP